MPNVINELKKVFKGDVITEREALYPYAFDSSPIDDGEVVLPEFVVFPRDEKEVSEVVKFANARGYTIIARGAATCHSGGCKVRSANTIIMHFSRMDKILEIDTVNMTARVQPNVVLGDFQREVEKIGLFFPPDPSNLVVSTIGGAIALSSGGPRTFKYGTMKDYVINLRVVDATGEIFETSANVAKNVTGYDLTRLFIGSEGELGLIVEATLKLIPKPECALLSLCYFDSVLAAGEAVNKIIGASITPSVLDLLDKNTLTTIEKFNPCGLLVDYAAALLIEIDGNHASVEYEQEKLAQILRKCGTKEIASAKNQAECEKIWKARRSAFGSVAKLKPNVVTEDIVVPLSKIPDLIRSVEELCAQYSITVCIMGHAGDGNIHPNFALDLDNEVEAKNFMLVKDKLFKLAISLGGTLSGEHGIGCEKRKYLDLALGKQALAYMKKIKQLFDPKGVFNSGKMF